MKLWIDLTGLLPVFEQESPFLSPFTDSQEAAQAKFFVEKVGAIPCIVDLTGLTDQKPPSVETQQKLMAFFGKLGEMPVVHARCLPLEGLWLTLRADWACPLLLSAPLSLTRLMLLASTTDAGWYFSRTENLSQCPKVLAASDWWLPVSRFVLDSALHTMTYHWGRNLRPQVYPLTPLPATGGEAIPDFESGQYPEAELLAYRSEAQILLRMKSHLLWQNLSFPPAA